MGTGGAATDRPEDRAVFTVSRASPVPLHVQIRNVLLGQIQNGRLKPGEQIPRERELGERFGVSLAPVRQALLDLAKEGYLQRVQGRGTFVREAKVEQKIAILSSFTESLRAEGVDGTVRVLRQEVVRAPAPVRSSLQVKGRQVLLIERLASAGEEPLALLRAYLPLSLAPELASARLEGQSLYAVLQETYGVDLVRAQSTIEVIRCDAVESALLEIPPGSQALLVEGVTYDAADRPVEYSRVTYRADRFRFALESHRRIGRVVHLMGHPPARPAEQDQRGRDG